MTTWSATSRRIWTTTTAAPSPSGPDSKVSVPNYGHPTGIYKVFKVKEVPVFDVKSLPLKNQILSYLPSAWPSRITSWLKLTDSGKNLSLRVHNIILSKFSSLIFYSDSEDKLIFGVGTDFKSNRLCCKLAGASISSDTGNLFEWLCNVNLCKGLFSRCELTARFVRYRYLNPSLYLQATNT